jgi:hypothetical protein
VGEKTDGPVLQKREQGPTPTPPTTPPPEGTTHTPPTTTTTTTTTTVTGGTTNIHTTTNRGTTNGTPAGGTNQGEPGPTPTGDTGEKNGSSGGANCEQPPTFTGDALLGNILQQNWQTRCNIENGEVEGADDCGIEGNGGAANTCTGDKILCHMVEQARKAKCALMAQASKLQDDADKAQESDEPFDPWGGNDESPGLDGNKLNMSAGTGELFPTFELEGVQMSMPQAIYDLLDIIKQIVIAAFTLMAMMIAGGSYRQ